MKDERRRNPRIETEVFRTGSVGHPETIVYDRRTGAEVAFFPVGFGHHTAINPERNIIYGAQMYQTHIHVIEVRGVS